MIQHKKVMEHLNEITKCEECHHHAFLQTATGLVGIYVEKIHKKTKNYVIFYVNASANVLSNRCIRFVATPCR